ncbi:unnamed protein product [Clavelina lepadiformis]|uniref:WD repeat-containing protein 34 n=1 Tax=Clavelina lepadiformis TaxID=159417 RepID=A0ABP0F9F0_CLALP
MFDDFTSKPVEFLSAWKTEKKLRENCSQTSEILTYEVESQTRRPRHAECQTESLIDLLNSSASPSQNLSYDQVTLSDFLKRVEPVVSKQLKVNIAAYSFYSGIFKTHDGLSELSITCEHCLEEKGYTSVQGLKKEATCISWSSSGASIAVSYGTNESIAWSDERSYVCLWNLDRPKMKSDACDQKVELGSSVQTLSFHPLYAGYLAAGLFSGVVLIWDIAKDEIVYGETSHEDPVTCLSWLEHQNSKYLHLLTGSSDGQLMLWRHRKGREGAAIKLEKAMRILGSNLPRRAGVKGHNPVGITCFAPARNDTETVRHEKLLSSSDVLAVGCENGSVLKCNIESPSNNPVVFVYEGHIGPVYSVDWSPFHRHLFLTCSTDQTCRLYHTLQVAPLREIRPEEAVGGKQTNYLYSALWSPTKPLLFYTAGSRGCIEVCDVASASSITSLEATGKDGKLCPINTMQISYKRANMLATGSSSGVVNIYKLGVQLVDADRVLEETKVLEDLANEAMTSD